MKPIRARRIVHISAIVVLLVFLFSPLVLAQSDQVLDTIEEVVQDTQEIRGLTELNPIDVRFMTTQELEQMLLEDLNEEYSAEDWARDEGLLKLMGFLKENDSYYDIMIELYTEQIAGFYDPEDKYLALISENTEMRAMDRINLSHEVTHALQDQYYHLDQPPYDVPDSTNYDVDFAASCLVEGDATLTMYLYQGDFSSEDYAEMMEDAGDIDSAKFDAAPQYVQDSLLFPYDQGMEFVEELYNRKEFITVNNAFADPPTSTEQVLHPEKYFSRENPVAVECPDISSSLKEGWELADTNVLGEFDIKELLMTELRKTNAAEGAAGWGGCQYRYYTDSGTGGRLMTIDLDWDSEAEAQEFAGMFEEYVDLRFNLDKGSYNMENGWAVWDTGKSGGVSLNLVGDETFIVFSSDKEALANAGSALGQGGEGLGGVLDRQPELEGKVDGKESSGSNVLVFGVVLGLLVLGLILLVGMIIISRKEKAARPVVYPAMPQQPPWMQQQQWPPQQWQQPPPPEPPPSAGSDA